MPRAQHRERPAGVQTKQVLRHAEEALHDAGLDVVGYPSFEAPFIREDGLAEVDEVELSELMAQLTAWSNYAAVELSRAEVLERAAEDFYEELRAIRHFENEARFKQVTDTKAYVAQLPEVREARQELLTQYAYRKMVASRARALEANLFAVSREITRRQGGQHGTPQQRRGSRYTP